MHCHHTYGVSFHNHGICPACGYCACCGRASWPIFRPWYPQPIVPQPPIYLNVNVATTRRPDPVVARLSGAAA